MRRLKRVLLTAAMGAGMLLSSPASARNVCKGSIKRGQISMFMKKNRGSTIVNTPLLEAGKHLRVTLPRRYMREVTSTSRKLPKPRKKLFISRMIQRNVALALSRLTRRTTTRFYCVPLKSIPTQIRPRPRTPATRPAPRRPAARRPPPRRPAATRRGRTIMIDIGEPARSAPRVKYSRPIRPYQKGGMGTQSRPYLIKVPVPHTKNGPTLFQGSFKLTLRSLNLSTVYFNYQFVGKSVAPKTTSVTLLASAMTDVAKGIIRRRLSAKGIHTTIPNFVLRVRSILRQARSNPFIKKYAR